ncbi:MAG: hypothetical protein IPG89_19490 [Bacteroidetes bacterium]|nr:hypothetical protein [Bacteroidota bacterium]
MTSFFGYSQNKYKNKQRSGYWVTYYDETRAKPQVKGKYKNGRQVGKWYHYTPNGDIEKKEIYKRKKVKVTYYYPSGEVLRKGNAKLILLDTLYRFYFTGEWKCYTIKGELSKMEYYEMGEIKNVVLFKTTDTPQFNDSLVKVIKGLYNDFYKWNDSITYITRNYGKATWQYQRIKKIEAANDSSIFSRMDLIIKKFGYPSKEMVGEEHTTLFFIISSYGIEIKDKYYDLIVAAGQKGILDKKDVSFFVDKVKIAHKLPQVYGTQFAYTNNYEMLYYPIEDINTVNIKRKEVGLEDLKISELKFIKY